MRNKFLGKPPKTMMNSQCDVIHNTQEQKKTIKHKWNKQTTEGRK